MSSRWAVQGATFVLWALAAASAIYWGFKLSVRGSAMLSPPLAARGPAAPDPAAIARLLGSSPQAAVAAAPSIASRLSLVGIAAHPSHAGIALISIDGKPPKPFRVGSLVEEGLVLQAVEPRRALLGPAAKGPPSVTLELPIPHRDARVEPSVAQPMPSASPMPSFTPSFAPSLAPPSPAMPMAQPAITLPSQRPPTTRAEPK